MTTISRLDFLMWYLSLVPVTPQSHTSTSLLVPVKAYDYAVPNAFAQMSPAYLLLHSSTSALLSPQYSYQEFFEDQGGAWVRSEVLASEAGFQSTFVA